MNGFELPESRRAMKYRKEGTYDGRKLTYKPISERRLKRKLERLDKKEMKMNNKCTHDTDIKNHTEKENN